MGVLACDDDMSQRIAAFAPVSGAFYMDDFGDVCEPETVPIEPCSPGRDDVPVLVFHGLVDDTIAYYGGPRRGGCLPTIPHWVQTWADRDGLGPRNETSAVPTALDGSSAIRYEFGEGVQKGLVTHIMDGTVSAGRRRRQAVLAAAVRAGNGPGASMLTTHAALTGHRARLAEHAAQQRQLAGRAAPGLFQRLVADPRLLRCPPAPAGVEGHWVQRPKAHRIMSVAG